MSPSEFTFHDNGHSTKMIDSIKATFRAEMNAGMSLRQAQILFMQRARQLEIQLLRLRQRDPELAQDIWRRAWNRYHEDGNNMALQSMLEQIEFDDRISPERKRVLKRWFRAHWPFP